MRNVEVTTFAAIVVAASCSCQPHTHSLLCLFRSLICDVATSSRPQRGNVL